MSHNDPRNLFVPSYSVVASSVERDSIPAHLKSTGMVVRLKDTGIEYVLGSDLTTWNVVEKPANIKTTSFTAAPGVQYLIDASFENINVTLPENPGVGWTVDMVVINASYEVGVIPASGDKLMGHPNRTTFARIGDGADLIFTGTTFGWSPRNEISTERQNVPLTAEDLSFTPTSDIPQTNTQAAIEAVNENALVYAMIFGS